MDEESLYKELCILLRMKERLDRAEISLDREYGTRSEVEGVRKEYSDLKAKIKKTLNDLSLEKANALCFAAQHAVRMEQLGFG